MLEKIKVLFEIIGVTGSTLSILLVLISFKYAQKKRVYEKQLILVQENENERISADLHDNFGSLISILRLQIQSISNQIKDSETKFLLSEAQNNVDEIYLSLKTIIKINSIRQFQNEGLIQSIKQYEKMIIQSKMIRMTFKHDIDEEILSIDASKHFFRIVQELINNSIKHSCCTEINILFKQSDSKFIIIYSDNGNLKRNNANEAGMGLRNIRYRTKLFNGIMYYKKDFVDGCFYCFQFDINRIKNNIKEKIYGQSTKTKINYCG